MNHAFAKDDRWGLLSVGEQEQVCRAAAHAFRRGDDLDACFEYGLREAMEETIVDHFGLDDAMTLVTDDGTPVEREWDALVRRDARTRTSVVSVLLKMRSLPSLYPRRICKAENVADLVWSFAGPLLSEDRCAYCQLRLADTAVQSAGALPVHESCRSQMDAFATWMAKHLADEAETQDVTYDADDIDFDALDNSLFEETGYPDLLADL